MGGSTRAYGLRTFRRSSGGTGSQPVRHRGRALRAIAATASAAVVSGMLAVVPTIGAAASSGTPFAVSLASILPDGSGPFSSTEVGVTASQDGRYVAFVGTGGGFTGQLFVRDRQANTTTLVSKDAGGAAAAHPVDAAAISANGNAIAFLTSASLLASVPDDGTEHVYVADWPSGTVRSVAVPQPVAGQAAAVGTAGVSLSADAGKVAFVRNNPADSSQAVVLVDTASGSPTVLPAQDGDVAYTFPQLSDDGSVVGYEAIDVNDNHTLRISSSGGAVLDQLGGIVAQDDDVVAPFSLSGDGKNIAYSTYVMDAQSVVVERIDGSQAPRAARGGGGRNAPRLATDGRAVSFAAGYLGQQLYVASPPDSSAGTLQVSMASDGSDANGDSTPGALTQNGLAVAFSSVATNLGGPTDGSEQVYYATSNDTAPPSWPSGAALSVDATSYFSADLSWPNADDDVGAAEYQLTIDGSRTVLLDAFQTAYTVTGLAPNTAHSFSIKAFDTAGRASDSLTAAATTKAVTRTEVIDTVSVLPDGEAADSSGINPSVSASGRYVAFTAAKSCTPTSGGGVLASGASTCYGEPQAFVRDREAGTTILLSHTTAGPTSVNDVGSVGDVALSGDGSEVAFVSDADGLVAGDTNGVADVFVADRATGVVHAVSVPDIGAPLSQVAYGKGLSMDADGTHVAYVAQDTSNNDHLIVEDWRAGTATVVPLPSTVWEVDEPQLSADGSRVALVANADDSNPYVMVIDLANPATPVLNRAIGYARYYGYDSNNYAPRIALSSDGRYLAYPNPADAAFRNIYVQDLSSLSTAPVVITSPTQPNCNTSTSACYDMGAPAFSADGSTIVFDPMNDSGNHTLYRASPITATPAPIALLPDGTTDNQYPGDRTPAATADGTGTVFQSNNDGIAALATGSDVVYAHDPDTTAPSFAAGAALTADNQTSTQVRLNWPAATDDHGVIGYRVTKDGVTIADLDPTATSFTVTGLTAGQTYQFAVSGVDAALNVGTPLALAFNSSGGSQQPGQAALVVDASAGGGHATLSWDPSTTTGVTGYRVLRGVGDTGPLTAIGDVSGVSTTSYLDSGLAASTTYRYEVHTLGSNGEQNYTVTTSVTTPGLGSATIAVNAVSVDGARAARLGSDVAVTVHGGPNLTGTATVGYTNADATTGSAQVSLTQTAADSGVYTGKFTLAEGIASVTSVSASLSDGAGHASTADATGLPIVVSGALKVTVDAPPAGSVDGSKLAVLSDTSETGGQATVNGGQTVTVPLASASDYTLTLTEPSSYAAAPSYAVATQNGISIAAGTTSTLELKPVLPAFLSVNVSPQAWAQVDVYDASGALIGTKTGADAAAADAFGPVPVGSQVTIDTTQLNDSVQVSKHQSTTVTLAAGSNAVSITHAPLPSATISGKLTVNGVVADYGHVTATETVDGRPWTFTTDTRTDGTYSLSVLAGDVTVSATGRDSLPGSKTVTVAAGATGNGDLDLTGPHHYQITLGLTTVEPDGSTATLPVDWRTAVHFGVSVHGPRYSSGFWNFEPTITVDGMPGDVYTMCADGWQAGLPAACNSVTLGDIDTATLDVVLVGAGRITGTLLGGNGQPFGGQWSAETYEIVNGQRRSIDNALGTGSALSIDIPAAGTYEVDVVGGYGLQAQPITVTVGSGAVVDVGRIPLGLDNNFGGSGNSVVAQNGEITPGQAAEFRASYHYAGGSTVPATIRLGIPAGATLVPGSVTVNGQGVADPSVVNGFAEVALPDLASGATGVLHYAVETTSATPAGPLTSIVRMKYGTSGDGLIGSATTTVVGVTLAAPTQIKGLTATVTGHAPAGATVNVFDEFGQQVGSGLATEGGLWSATVNLAARGEGHTYALQAVTTVGGVTVRSDTQLVTHNSHTVMPTSLSVGQPDGRLVSFDPNSGVARFPYVFVPGMGISVSACFATGTQVSNMSARIGPQLGGASGVGVLYGSASPGLVSNAKPRSNAALIQSNSGPSSVNSAALVGGSGGGNCYSAQLNPSTSQLGAIYLDYTANPAPFNASDFQLSAGAANENLPPALANHTGDQSTDNADGSHTFTTSLPSLGGASISTTSRITPSTYVPTAADLAAAAGAGVPVYGFSTNLSEGTNSITAELHAYVPQSWLQAYLQGSSSTALAPQTSAAHALALRPAGLAADLFEVTVDVGIDVGNKGETLESIKDALTAGGPYQELSKLLDEIDNSNCGDAFTKQNLANYLQGVANQIRNIQIVSSIASVAGVFAGALLGPLGSLALGAALDYFGDRAEQNTLDSAAKFVKDNLAQCIKNESDEVADPDWVIDPSGFTYEAVTSNPLSGVTATLLRAQSADGPFTVWDAAAYGQENPLTTDAQGKYGWNVPFGYWKVAYTKPGYETAYSQVFQIPPPRFDVNVGLVRLAAPTVTLTRATSGTASGVTIGFDDYLKVDSVTSRVSVVDGSGNSVAGSVQAVDAQAAPDGTNLAKTFRFVPDQPFTDGESLTLTVDALVRDYADHTLDSAFTASLTASAPTTPGAANDVHAFAIDAHTVRVEWTAPGDDGGSPLTGFHVTASAGKPVDVAADATSVTMNDLSPMTNYTVAVSAVNAVGAGAAQSALVTTPPLAPDEAFGSFQVPPAIDGGTSGQGTVTLPAPAAEDTTVTLVSDSPVASVPHSVTVPAGQSTATFTVTTTDPVLDTDVTVTANRGGVSLDTPVTVHHVDVPLQATASDGSVALSWTAASGSDVTGYRVMRATGPDGEFAAVADVNGIATTTYTDTGLAAGTTYRYQVLALYAAGAASPWSAVAEATTPVVVTPVSLSATVSPSAPTYGQDVTVTVTMTPSVAGAAVEVSEGTTVLASGTIGADGTASIVVSGLHAGDHQLTVSYAGDAATTPAQTAIDVSVAKAATTLTVDKVTSLRDLLALMLGRYEVTAHLLRSDGVPVAGEQVVIDSWAGQFCVATTDAAGVARCPVPPRLRSVVLLGQVHASYAGSADYLPASFGSVAPPGRGR